MTECLIILGENTNITVRNLGKVVVASGKGDQVCVIREIKDQISRLKEEANKAKAKPLNVGYDHPTVGTDAHAQQLMNLGGCKGK
jgi:hypothetical protein